MGEIIMRFIATLHIFNNLIVAKKELLPEELLLFVLEGYLRNQFSHVIEDDILVIWVEV